MRCVPQSPWPYAVWPGCLYPSAPWQRFPKRTRALGQPHHHQPRSARTRARARADRMSYFLPSPYAQRQYCLLPWLSQAAPRRHGVARRTFSSNNNESGAAVFFLFMCPSVSRSLLDFHCVHVRFVRSHPLSSRPGLHRPLTLLHDHLVWLLPSPAARCSASPPSSQRRPAP